MNGKTRKFENGISKQHFSTRAKFHLMQVNGKIIASLFCSGKLYSI